MHEKGIIHRDLKLDNILVKKNLFKIADFGFSIISEYETEYAGTPLYMSPEIIKKLPYDYKTDIWSLGVILFLMLYREFPFTN